MSSSPSSITKTSISQIELFDWGARIGAAAYSDGIKASQLENIISILDTVEGNEALLLVATFAQRQSKRLKQGYNLAKIVTEAMLYLFENNLGKDAARMVLGIARWVFDALQGAREFRREELEKLTLKDILSHLSQVRR